MSYERWRKNTAADAVLVLTVIVLFLVCFKAWGEDKKTIQVSDKEKIAILQAQKEQLAASQALQNTAEYRRMVDAQTALQKLGTDVFTSRKITQAEYALCDGPSQGVCEKVAKGDIELVPQPKPAKEESKK
jgi:hypothetical protein